MKDFKEFLEANSACSEAMEWAATKDYDLLRCWHECERGDWLLWLVARLPCYTFRQITGAKAECAALVLSLMKDERSRNAVEVARRYGINEATDEELTSAYDAADAAAADAAAWTARAARAAAWTAAYAADADAAAAAWAATAAAWTAAKKEMLDKCAQAVRAYLHEPTL